MLSAGHRGLHIKRRDLNVSPGPGERVGCLYPRGFYVRSVVGCQNSRVIHLYLYNLHILNTHIVRVKRKCVRDHTILNENL